MFRSEWRDSSTIRRMVVGVGMAGILALLFVVVASVSAPSVERQTNQRHTSAQIEEARREADRQTQNSMMWAAWAQAGVAALGLLGLGATVIFAGLAWKETKRGADSAKIAAAAAIQANADAREFFAFERRPWIEIVPVTATITSNEMHATIGYEVRNIGLSPALNVGVLAPRALAHFNAPSFMTLQRRMADRTPTHAIGAAIYPARNRKPDMMVDLQELPHPLPWMFYLEGFVEYQTRVGGPLHFTPFVWVLKFNRDLGTGPPTNERLEVSFFTPPPT